MSQWIIQRTWGLKMLASKKSYPGSAIQTYANLVVRLMLIG